MLVLYEWSFHVFAANPSNGRPRVSLSKGIVLRGAGADGKIVTDLCWLACNGMRKYLFHPLPQHFKLFAMFHRSQNTTHYSHLMSMVYVTIVSIICFCSVGSKSQPALASQKD